MKPLNDKQQRFVQEYIKDLNATQAAIRAGYSARTAHSQGPRLLDHVGVSRAIDQAKRERSEKTKIDAEWVLKELQVQYHKADGEDERQHALRSLDLIGKHVSVQAFREQLEVTETTTLAEKLRRARERAANRD